MWLRLACSAAWIVGLSLPGVAAAGPITIHESVTIGRQGCNASFDSGTYTVDAQNGTWSAEGPSTSGDVSDCVTPIRGGG